MNYKLLFPTFRNRYLFVTESLQQYADKGFRRGLNLGTGEGDYDHFISNYCEELIGCDINEKDIRFARLLNASVSNLEYRVEDALDLSFEDDSFDLLVSVEVLEHVGKPEKMVAEIGRVLKPGGISLITFPRFNFPLSYDPVNKLFRKSDTRVIAQGAYAFGHEYLIKTEEFESWCRRHGLEIVRDRNLSGGLVGLLEMYWTGLVQKLFKDNASNLSGDDRAGLKLRPSNKAPWLTIVTDGIIRLDRLLFGRTRSSVGKGYVLRKT